MDLHDLITASSWWQRAERMPDRHHPADASITLADHLAAVHDTLEFLTDPAAHHPYFADLAAALQAMALDPAWLHGLLAPVALLHDIGKVSEDENELGPHPLTGELVELRHPVLSVRAALEILPANLAHRDRILALVEQHDTPYAWYTGTLRGGSAPPGAAAWSRLDRRLDPREDGTGIVALAVFKLADVDGHAVVDDVAWFIDQANRTYLAARRKPLPVPDAEAVRSLQR